MEQMDQLELFEIDTAEIMTFGSEKPVCTHIVYRYYFNDSELVTRDE